MWQQNQPRVVYFQTTGKLLVKKTDLQALTLVGLSRQDPEPDPLAVLHLNNWLYLLKSDMKMFWFAEKFVNGF